MNSQMNSQMKSMSQQIPQHVSGREYWRSLEQMAADPKVSALIETEFPGYDPGEIRTMSRRRFMKLMAASMALAGIGLTGCRRWPKEKLAPYTSQPKERIAGVAEYYASVYEIGGVGNGVLVRSFDGRPIKIEGNPTHPFARSVNERIGSADTYAQASVLDLYDPNRSRGVQARMPVSSGTPQVRPTTWEAFERFSRQHFGELRGNGGAGFAILSESMSGPTYVELRKRLAAAYPQAKWYEYEPLGRANELVGARLAFGQAVRQRLHLEKAQVVVSLDGDFLGNHPAHTRYAADWSMRRRSVDAGQMSRVYVAESGYTNTGAVADERLAIKPSRMGILARELAVRLGIAGISGGSLWAKESQFLEHAAADLQRAGASALVVAGSHVPPDVQAVVHTINSALGAIGNTVRMLAEPQEQGVGTIVQLAAEMRGGAVQTLLILGGNPAYNAPADLDFRTLLAKVPTSIHASVYNDETSALCAWHLPRAHYLESWGDARAWDGTVSVQQPLIEPLYGGRSVIEVLAGILGEPVRDGESLVRRTLAEQRMIAGTGDALNKAWRRVLHDGIVPNSGFAEARVTARQLPASLASAASTEIRQSGASPLFCEVRFVADNKVYDGRFANNGWLQETPDPLTKLTWDNAALIAKVDADALGVTSGSVVKVTVGGRSLEIAAYVMPGQPLGVVTLPLGYFRRAAGSVGNAVGFDTYSLRTSDSMDVANGTVEKTGRTYELALTQDHFIIDEVGFEGRSKRIGPRNGSGKIIHETTLKELTAHPETALSGGHAIVPLPLYEPPYRQPPADPDAPGAFNAPHAWGMAIDMTVCTGCTACVVACQAENNVPVVGKSQVLKSREMHWLRIDRYFKGSIEDENPPVVFQAMMCVHCENAPCEQVCPVAATVHDTEGLNTMVYNRCIGTRYCSNNCPYKVRRFNYFDYHSRNPRGGNDQMPFLKGLPDQEQEHRVDPIKRMVYNPDVTVRMRGVMEKCTYCVQRISEVKIDKRNAGESIKDGDVVTACQQACPTQAIVFGNLNDKTSNVRKLHANKRAYGVLNDDLNTSPRTKHLARVKNPAISPQTSAAGDTAASGTSGGAAGGGKH